MQQQLGQITFLVDDYDKAIQYFVDRLSFELLEDTDLGTKRWVRIAPTGSGGASLLLAQAKNDEQLQQVGCQAGGRVAFFLYTDDFWRDYQSMQDAKIDFIGEPRQEDYGTVIVFRDLYGNKWDFIQVKQ